jgi:hypothetical protein
MSTDTIVLPPGGGRAYELGAMRGVFKADGAETGDFENRGDERATAFNVFIPGGFEASFAEWAGRPG